MTNIRSSLLDIGGLERLAAQDSPVHRLDPRAKVIATLAFILTVVSYGKYEISPLAPLALYPVVMIAAANLPPGYLLGKILLASPFALMLGAFNPLLDQATMAQFHSFSISGGWISYASLLVRFSLTLLSALILISTTGFNTVCLALSRLGTPRILVLQFMLLYRYLFVLGEEAAQMSGAWSLRAFGNQKMPLGVFASLSTQLLLRTIERAQRLHMAMLSRGFQGEIRLLRPLAFTTADWTFAAGWMAFFLLARFVDLSRILGQATMGWTL